MNAKMDNVNQNISSEIEWELLKIISKMDFLFMTVQNLKGSDNEITNQNDSWNKFFYPFSLIFDDTIQKLSKFSEDVKINVTIRDNMAKIVLKMKLLKISLDSISDYEGFEVTNQDHNDFLFFFDPWLSVFDEAITDLQTIDKNICNELNQK